TLAEAHHFAGDALRPARHEVAAVADGQLPLHPADFDEHSEDFRHAAEKLVRRQFVYTVAQVVDEIMRRHHEAPVFPVSIIAYSPARDESTFPIFPLIIMK